MHGETLKYDELHLSLSLVSAHLMLIFTTTHVSLTSSLARYRHPDGKHPITDNSCWWLQICGYWASSIRATSPVLSP